MSKTYRPYDPEQLEYLPAALQEWLPPEHMAYFISDVVEELAPVGHHGPVSERRGVAVLPTISRMLVKVLLYGYCPEWHRSRRDRPASPRGHCLSGCSAANNIFRTVRTISD